MSAAVINWREIADALYQTARSAGCICEYERTGGGVPMWFPTEGGGIARKLTKRCARCTAIERYQAEAAR